MELANSIITLQPGMYVLRHPKSGLPPISISRAAGSASSTGRIEALYTPGTDGGVLRNGADCIVMHVLNAPVDLLVTAYLEHVGATVPALKVDKIGLDNEAALVRHPGSAAPKPIAIPPKGISLIGHIERAGNVVATPGQRLGDPVNDLRLEGFQVMWPDRPEGVDLAYSARVEGAEAALAVTTGKFCGTRNDARRIVEVTFSLTGPKASQYKLEGKSHFSGGFETAILSGTPLTGPTGLEHLTALTLQIAAGLKGEKKRNSPWEASARTKVFKGGTLVPIAPSGKSK